MNMTYEQAKRYGVLKYTAAAELGISTTSLMRYKNVIDYEICNGTYYFSKLGIERVKREARKCGLSPLRYMEGEVARTERPDYRPDKKPAAQQYPQRREGLFRILTPIKSRI